MEQAFGWQQLGAENVSDLSFSNHFPFNRQIRLSWIARSTCPRK
jgi:hypothetical protein